MTNEESLYGKRLTGKWREAFTDAQNYDYETIIRESFYVAHGRVISQIEGAGKFGKESKTLLQACEVLVEQGELTQEFVEELKLRLLGLDLEGMLRAFQGTLVLADGAMRLSKMGDIRRQLEICKAFIVAVLKNSGDRVARELALSCIQQLKLDADLPLERLEALINEAQETDIEGVASGREESSEIQASDEQENQDVLEGDLWDG
ncbi:hypothetical protein G7B40_040320 [Aetokthonos hydrillicola Thurmond2011]|jgi:hypothetical protein|uniref:Uncharacterized protein n=1 Tax=Aetokthonos hydrillicola Thurmond2011 TaxID=2712845 RepID=A0AAP5IFN5_9CYAN|nr:hypothetical protein [Aetokthonos hydrillicola]MBO3459975.1 hypothetical protein [Aetokthonos hydrillicola CCALA 1050]MBW4584094.1 hypothetical protein [Aetokthonos hydrillicola CCALA 1050]MDR9900736.1 hypothetical protein [Aetokthonos hydrillicola Thurmond2011]